MDINKIPTVHPRTSNIIGGASLLFVLGSMVLLMFSWHQTNSKKTELEEIVQQKDSTISSVVDNLLSMEYVHCIAIPKKKTLPDGKDLYTFQFSIIDTAYCSGLKEVEYDFDNPTFHQKKYVVNTPQNGFGMSYVGWGCLDSVTIVFRYWDHADSPDTLRYAMC